MSVGARGADAPGAVVRAWRVRRRLSQLALAHAADVSPRHLSCVETGRSAPSRAVLARLCDALEVPLRERNALHLAAGFAPPYPESPPDGASLAPVLASLRRVVAAHDPFPAVVLDRSWEVVEANDAVEVLLDGVAPDLLEPPVNVLRVALHPRGLAPRVENLAQWRAELLGRLRREVDRAPASGSLALLRELESYPAPGGAPASRRAAGRGSAAEPPPAPATPLRLRTGDRTLTFLATIATFGTPTDVTLAELTIETFLPADDATASALARRGRERAAGRAPGEERGPASMTPAT